MTYIWKDALEFEDCGGFHVETQFAHEMGQGYLLACGVPGIPVSPAKGKFKIKKDGMYRIWVRTKNWYPSHSPGKLKVLVDDQYLETELGTLPITSWYFEIAGDIKLEKGEHDISVEDTTGYFGRFSSVVISDDMNFIPDSQKERLWKQRAEIKDMRLVTICNKEWDVIVVGAGPAGVPAAIAAARKGMNVALINSRPILGGNGSDEAGVKFVGANYDHVNMRETGIAEEIRRIRDFNKITWQEALERLVESEKKITVFFNQTLIDAVTESSVIKTIKTLHCINSTMTIFKGKMFIDATGDGWLGYYSGASCRIGREAEWQHNESHAPEAADSSTMSGCLMGNFNGEMMLGYYAQEQEEDVPFTAPNWAVQLPEGDALHRNPGRKTTGSWWLENPGGYDDLWEQEKVRDELLRLSLGYFHWIKNSYSRRDLVRKYKIVALPKYNAKRENRRIIGDYILTQNDCVGKRFEDAVSYCGWPLDIHHPKGIFSGEEGPFYCNLEVPITDIPFRCLYSKDIKNLMMAGRCISVTHLALGTVRVQNTIATLGQAAGIACAICVEDGIYPRDIFKKQMSDFQQLLLKDDMYIVSVKNNDPNDVARTATVKASSVNKAEIYKTNRGFEGDFIKIEGTVAAAMKLEKKPQYAKAYLKNSGIEDIIITASVAKLPNCCWYDKMNILDTAQCVVNAGFEGFVQIPLNVDFDDFDVKWLALILTIPEGGDIYWKCMYCTGGEKSKSKKLDTGIWDSNKSFFNNESYVNSYVFEFYDQGLKSANCSVENIINGYSRVVNKDIYAWVSDPKEDMPQWIELKLENPAEISTITVVYDTDLLNSDQQQVVQNTVSDYTIDVFSNGQQITVAEVQGNYMRRCNHTFNKVVAEAVRINVTKTWGSKSVRIFEVRIY